MHEQLNRVVLAYFQCVIPNVCVCMNDQRARGRKEHSIQITNGKDREKRKKGNDHKVLKIL